MTLRVVGTKLAANQDAAVAIRQHDIQLSTNVPQGAENTVKATVTRQVFLGANRDYVIETVKSLEALGYREGDLHRLAAMLKPTSH